MYGRGCCNHLPLCICHSFWRDWQLLTTIDCHWSSDFFLSKIECVLLQSEICLLHTNVLQVRGCFKSSFEAKNDQGDILYKWLEFESIAPHEFIRNIWKDSHKGFFWKSLDFLKTWLSRKGDQIYQTWGKISYNLWQSSSEMFGKLWKNIDNRGRW